MNFVESIKTCFTKYADFGGCASRPELWWWTLFTFIASMTLASERQFILGVYDGDLPARGRRDDSASS